MLAIESLYRGHLLLARPAPGGPEVQEDDLAAIVRQPLRLPLQVRQAEVGRRHAHDERLVLGALEPDHAEREREDGQPAEAYDQPAARRRMPRRLHLRSGYRHGLFSTRMNLLTHTGC